MEKDHKHYKCAKKNFQALCKYFDKNNWKYETDDEELKSRIRFNYNGGSLVMQMVFTSNGSFSVFAIMDIPDLAENKRAWISAAAALANNNIGEGSFDYSLSKDNLIYRLSYCFIDRELNDAFYSNMISIAHRMASEYRQRFAAVCTTQIKSWSQLKKLMGS